MLLSQDTDILLNKSFQCVILSKERSKVEPGKIGSVVVAETNNFFLALIIKK